MEAGIKGFWYQARSGPTPPTQSRRVEKAPVPLAIRCRITEAQAEQALNAGVLWMHTELCQNSAYRLGNPASQAVHGWVSQHAAAAASCSGAPARC